MTENEHQIEGNRDNEKTRKVLDSVLADVEVSELGEGLDRDERVDIVARHIQGREIHDLEQRMQVRQRILPTQNHLMRTVYDELMQYM